MKRPFVVTHKIRQTEIAALLDSWVTNTPVKMLCPHKICLSFYFLKNMTCLSGGLLRVGQVFFVSCKIVYRWVTTNFHYMNNIFYLKIDYYALVISNGKICGIV